MSLEPTRPSEPAEFSTVEEEGRHWLTVLRYGSAEEKLTARVRLARLFERRGQLDEAAELYENNVRAGARDPALYRLLAEVYRLQGRETIANQVLVEALRLDAADESDRDAAPAMAPLSDGPAPAPPLSDSAA